MKKIGVFILFFLVFLILYFLQANFFSWFTIAGIMPNLFIIFILFIGLFAGRNIGITAGILFGICLDFFIGKSLGISSIMLGIVGFLGGYFDKNFSKESRITIMLMIAGCTAVYEIGSYVCSVFLLSVQPEILIFTKKVLIEMGYNVLLIIILYPLFQTLGYAIEDVYKGSNVLTRYF